MTKYTPGPWEAADDHWVIADDAARTFVCRVRRVDTDARRMANARLIAAAPALLEALETLVALHADCIHLDDFGVTVEQHINDTVRPAIKAARGDA